jgi:hypothetical protein
MSAILCLALSAALQEAELKFTKFDFARERVGHKVVADAVLFNGLESDLEDLAVIVVYYDRDLELKRSATFTVASLPSGKSAPLKIEVAQLPNFSRYEVFVAGGGGKWLFHGADPLQPPSARRREPARLDVAEARTAALAAPGDASVTLVVRNLGELDALEPTALITFDGAAPTRVRLAPSMQGASRDTYLVTVPGAPAHRGVHATVAWLAAEGPMQKDGDTRGVALRRFRTGRLTDGAARIDGEVGNGLDKVVEKVAVTFTIGAKTAVVPVPGSLKAGEVRAFEAYVPDCPAIDSVAYVVAFESAEKGAAAGAPPRTSTSRRLESKTIELAGPKLPPSAALPKEPPPKAPERPKMRIELRGMMLAQGYYSTKLKKHTGDVYFLKLAFLDPAGKTLRPDAEIEITLTEDKKEPVKVERSVTPRAWAAEAGRITSDTADAATMASDRKTGELWVGLLRTDAEFNPKADIRVTIKDEGTWTWSAVGGKFLSAPRSPDPLK